MMADADHGSQSEADRNQVAEQAFLARERAEQSMRRVSAAQRSAADSLDRSADSQDRTAKKFETAAEHSVPDRKEFRERAARHREFAQEDRRLARQMRQKGMK